jgi:hypothetical protein
MTSDAVASAGARVRRRRAVVKKWRVVMMISRE